MKKIGIIKLSAILFLTFGITALNFENLNIDVNYKAYTSIIVGIITTMISLFIPQTLKE